VIHDALPLFDLVPDIWRAKAPYRQALDRQMIHGAPVNVDGTSPSNWRWCVSLNSRSGKVLKAILALGAIAAVSVGLLLPAPMLHGRSGPFLQPGVSAQ
jgi:hypothetical protein